jgi:hypothetical protein
MISDAANQNPNFLRKAMIYLHSFIQNLDYTVYDETTHRIDHAMSRISALEREVGEIKAQRSGAGVIQEDVNASAGDLR